MNKLDRLDILIDLSLSGEANDAEISELQELAASSDDFMEHYFDSIDQQLTLKQQFENSLLDSTYIQAPSKKTPFLWMIIPFIILVAMLIIVNWNSRFTPQKIQLTISKESHDFSVLRNNKDLNNFIGKKLEKLDLIDVGQKGEMWLQTAKGDVLYLAGGSQVRMEQKSTEAFQLLKGSLRADLSQGKTTLSFITRDIELIADKARFSATVKNNITKICVMKGILKITRLKDGKSLTVKENQAVQSDTLQISAVAPEDAHIFPQLEKGVNYYYFEMNNGSYDENRLIDEGIVNSLSFKRGQHEGYVRGRPDSHSDVAQGPFQILFKSLFKAENKGLFSFRVKGRKGTSLSIDGKSVKIKENFSTEILSLNLEKGFYPIKVLTPGILESDTDEFDLTIEFSYAKQEYIKIPDDLLYHRNPHPLPNQFTEENIDRSLSARLPLKGNFKDIINNQDAAPIGSPQFIKDPEFGIVCELDGKKDYLVHLPVDQLGMAQNYTASAWIKIHQGAHYDQPLFANSAGDYNATLVLLIRRLHPYLAHLHNDTVAGEKLQFNKWAHIVFRYHKGEQAIFVDGKLAVNSYNHSSLFSNQPLQIGCWNGNRKIKGLLRDIRIYNTALSASDIDLLYKKTSKKKNEGP